jgi:hypothetical protein
LSLEAVAVVQTILLLLLVVAELAVVDTVKVKLLMIHILLLL